MKMIINILAKKKNIFCIILMVVCTFAIVYRCVDAHKENERLRNDIFHPASGLIGYSKKQPVHEIDFEYINTYINKGDIGGDRVIDYPVTYVLKKDLNYYSMEEDGSLKVAYTIPKGSSILWRSRETNGYGLYSYPTYERGLRYAAPFLIVDERDIEATMDSEILDRFYEEIMEQPHYYVKLKDLADVFEGIYNTDEVMKSKIFIPEHLSKKQVKDNVLLSWDGCYLFFDVYLSPDRMLEVWDSWNSALAAIVLAIGILMINNCIEEKRRSKDYTTYSRPCNKVS